MSQQLVRVIFVVSPLVALESISGGAKLVAMGAPESIRLDVFGLYVKGHPSGVLGQVSADQTAPLPRRSSLHLRPSY